MKMVSSGFETSAATPYHCKSVRAPPPFFVPENASVFLSILKVLNFKRVTEVPMTSKKQKES